MSAAAVRVVSDASPIMNLAAVGRLGLLRQLSGMVLIPEAVREEVVRGRGLPGAKEVKTQPWIVTEHVEDRTQVVLLNAELDDGEAEVLALALQLRAAGREPRVLVAAKKRGLLDEVGPVFRACLRS